MTSWPISSACAISAAGIATSAPTCWPGTTPGRRSSRGGLVLHVRTRVRRQLSLAALAEILGKPRAEGVYRQLPVVVRRELAVSPLDPGLDAWDLDD